jgi:hypothetical protein
MRLNKCPNGIYHLYGTVLAALRKLQKRFESSRWYFSKARLA